MPFFSNYAESGVLSHIFRSDTLAKPSVLAIAALATPPSDSDTTLAGRELAHTGAYERRVLNPSDSNWAFTFTNGSGSVYNNAIITFDVATADWGWVSGIAICDASGHNLGNYIVGGTLVTPKLIGSGDQLKLNVQDCQLFLD